MSPLNALMKDQVNALSAKGVKVVHVNGCFDNYGEDVKTRVAAEFYSYDIY